MLEQKTIQAINKLIQEAAAAAAVRPIDPDEIRAIAELVSAFNVSADPPNDTAVIVFTVLSGGEGE
jgi:uncharacterized protein with PhoU and TrkA domain